MDTIRCIKTRRSIRRFTDEPITAEQIARVVSAAAYAPSWKNSQTTRYTAVVDPELKQCLARECMMGFSHNEGITKGAPALIVVRTVEGRSGYERDGSPTTSKGSHWQSFDAGIASATFCLAAHELGLGTVIMGIFDEKKVASLLGLSEGESVSALIALGHPDEEPDTPKKKNVEDLLEIR
ncbi:MAG: nitroreductase family protein [Clostridia bacterium]|nr:nitroreductase family protein [Clostridia bacterium]